jgi:predicted  nucleic acid-binding Zn-ribbon protein
MRPIIFAVAAVCMISFAVACGGEAPRQISRLEALSAEESNLTRELIDKEVAIGRLKTTVKQLEAKIVDLEAQLAAK